MPLPFCVALSQSVYWHESFLYCCALYNLFFLGFRQWQSRADRIVNLNATILLPLFWRTWTWALASLAHMCWPGTWPEIISIVEPRGWLTARSVASFFLISRKYRKNKGLVRDFSKAHAPGCAKQRTDKNLNLHNWNCRIWRGCMCKGYCRCQAQCCSFAMCYILWSKCFLKLLLLHIQKCFLAQSMQLFLLCVTHNES